jgi:hypothetical protein
MTQRVIVDTGLIVDSDFMIYRKHRNQIISVVMP